MTHKTGWFHITFPEWQPVTRVRSWGLNALDNTTSSWQPVICNISWSCVAFEGPQEVGEWLERSLDDKKESKDISTICNWFSFYYHFYAMCVPKCLNAYLQSELNANNLIP